MSGYTAFLCWKAMKAHFTTNYDYHRYAGKIPSGSADRFQKSNEKMFFYKIDKLIGDSPVENFFVAQFLYSDPSWIGECVDEMALKRFRRYESYLQSPMNFFQNDIDRICLTNTLKNALSVERGSSVVLDYVVAGRIEPITLLILDDFFGTFKTHDKFLKDHLIWQHFGKKLVKAKKFFTYEKDCAMMKQYLVNVVRKQVEKLNITQDHIKTNSY